MKGLLCPKCGHNQSTIVDMERRTDRTWMRRRRECKVCKTRYSTVEVIEDPTTLARMMQGSRQRRVGETVSTPDS